MTIAEEMKKQFEVLKGEEMYFVKDQRNMDYFALNPANTDRQEVLTKISAVNNLELNELAGNQDMADHIVSLNIDERLKKNDLSLVEDIANITIQGKKQKLMNFASVYCNYHKPDVYPIYSDQHFAFLNDYVKEMKLDVDPNQLDNYLVRKKIQDDIINRFFGEQKLNYFTARKFGWLYLGKFLEEAKEKLNKKAASN